MTNKTYLNYSVSYDELYNSEVEPLGFIVDGLLAPGVYMLAGPSKIGKTWFALDLALCVSEGSPFIGRSTLKSSVLYLSYDDSEERIKRRLKIIDRGEGKPIDFDFKLKGLDGELEEYIVTQKNICSDLKLVIIDVLQKVIPMGKADYSADYNYMDRFKSLAEKLGLCILLITHTVKKIDKRDPFLCIRGSGGITAGADGYITIFKSNFKGIITLCAAGNDIENVDEQIVFDREKNIWKRHSFHDGLNSSKRDIFLSALYFYMSETEHTFRGTATEIKEIIEDIIDDEVDVNKITKYLSESEEELSDCGISVRFSRSSEKREIIITYDPDKDHFAQRGGAVHTSLATR